MTEPLHITSEHNPRIKRLLKLRKSRDRRKSGMFIAEGRREVERAYAAGLVIEELYVCDELLGNEPIAISEQIERVQMSAAVLCKAAYRQDPEGVLAVVRQPSWSLEALAKTGLFLIAVGTEKPGNLGAMVRTAAAAGCAAVLATGPVDAFNPNAIRASTGAVFSMPVVEADDEAILSYCQAQGLTVIASTPNGGKAYTEVDFRGGSPPGSPPGSPGIAIHGLPGVALVIGPEDRGLDACWLTAASERVTIPMAGGVVDSLNASTSAAVLLFEARRQRGNESQVPLAAP